MLIVQKRVQYTQNMECKIEVGQDGEATDTCSNAAETCAVA